MKRIALISFPLALVIAAACQEGVVDPTDDASLVPGPQFAKWLPSPTAGCTANAGVKFQLTGKGLRVTGTSGADDVDCSVGPAAADITFSGGDGNDTFVGGDGDDHMVGGNGDDDLDGGGGINTAIGGEGTDTCSNAVKQTGCENIA